MSPKSNKVVWIVPVLLIVVVIVGYAGFKYSQYSGQWREFDAARQSIDKSLPASVGYSWEPGVFSATGSMDLSDREINDEQLGKFVDRLKSVATLDKLDLSGNALTDAAVPHLAKMSYLRELVLRGNEITDGGWTQLQASLPNCQMAR